MDTIQLALGEFPPRHRRLRVYSDLYESIRHLRWRAIEEFRDAMVSGGY